MKQGRKAVKRQEGRKASQLASASLPSCRSALLVFALPASRPGCTRAHAKVIPDSPPLDMPAPPPREVEPNDTETPPAGAAAGGAGAQHADASASGASRASSRAPSRRGRSRQAGADAGGRTAEAGRGAAEAADDAADDAADGGRRNGARRSGDDQRATADLNRVDYRAAERRRAHAVRHREEFHPTGGGGGARKESGVREERSRTKPQCWPLSWPAGSSLHTTPERSIPPHPLAPQEIRKFLAI